MTEDNIKIWNDFRMKEEVVENNFEGITVILISFTDYVTFDI